jgi:hypothetical protein
MKSNAWRRSFASKSPFALQPQNFGQELRPELECQMLSQFLTTSATAAQSSFSRMANLHPCLRISL